MKRFSNNTIRIYSQGIAHWVGFAHPRIAKIDDSLESVLLKASKTKYKDIQEFAAHLENDIKISKYTIRGYLYNLSGFYKWLMIHKKIDNNPFLLYNYEMSHLKLVPTNPTQALEQHEVAFILELSKESPRDHALMALLFGAGLRISELLSIKIEDITLDYEYYRLRLYNTKTINYSERSISKWVGIIVESYMRSLPKESSFLFEISRQDAWRIFKRYTKLAGITKRVSPHSARATAITQLLDNGSSYRDVMRFSGHASMMTVQRYDRRKDDLKKNPGLYLAYSR